MRNMVLSPAAAATFRCAATLARAYGHGYVGSEHLLLAMLVRTESAAGENTAARGCLPRRRSLQSWSNMRAGDRGDCFWHRG